MIRRLLCAIGRHDHTYREKRDVWPGRFGPAPGARAKAVWHFVCPACGQAWPVLDRSAATVIADVGDTFLRIAAAMRELFR